MCKEEFRCILIENGIYYVKIIRTPDGRGGYRPVVCFNYGAENYELQDFEYIEYEGNLNDAVDSYNKVFESVYDCGVRMVNYQSLAQLVDEKVYGYEQQLYTSQEAILQTNALASLANPRCYPRRQTLLIIIFANKQIKPSLLRKPAVG